MFLIICSPIVGVVGANVLDSDSRILRSLYGALAGLAGAVVVGLLLIAFCALFVAPLKQRNEARKHLREAGDLKRLLLLRHYLREQSQTNRRFTDDAVNRKLTGPVPEFADFPVWVLDVNQGTKSQLEALGFPELVPQLVLDSPELDTWEEVLLAAKRIDRKTSEFLGGKTFQVLEYELPDHA